MNNKNRYKGAEAHRHPPQRLADPPDKLADILLSGGRKEKRIRGVWGSSDCKRKGVRFYAMFLIRPFSDILINP